MSDYKKKYLKYKKKYLNIRKIHGGMMPGDQTHLSYQGDYPEGDYPQENYFGDGNYYQQSDPSHSHLPQGPPQYGYPQYDPSQYGYPQYDPPQHGPPGHGPPGKGPPEHGPPGKGPPGQGPLNLLREKFEQIEEENTKLKEACAEKGWDSKKGAQKSPFTKDKGRIFFFSPSGPFIFNRKTNIKEDQITEFKQYDIYSSYNPPNKITYPGDGIKDLHYTDGSQTTGSLRFILRKTFVGFLNTTGGRLFLGITDKGISVGIPNVHTRDHIDHLEQKISQEVFNKIVPQPPVDNIIFIWHWVYHHKNYESTENGSKDYWILEIQIGPGSRDIIYESPKDVIKDQKDKDQTIWFRQASATISVSKSKAESFIEQNKLVCSRELLEPLNDESGLKPEELADIERTEEPPPIEYEEIPKESKKKE